MKVSLATIKNWFKTGLKPTQSQFWDTWDSFWHKDDSIPTSSVAGLDAALSGLPTPEQLAILATVAPVVVNVAGSATYALQAGKFLEVVVADGASGSAKVGTSAGGSEIVEAGISTGSPMVARVDAYAPATMTVYFTGNFTAKLYLR